MNRRRMREWSAICLLTAAGTAAVAQTQETRLTPERPVISDIYGHDVAIGGDTILVGAPFGARGGKRVSGNAFVHQLVDGVWTETQMLSAEKREAMAFFGASVDFDGTTMLISASGEDRPLVNIGAAYIFELRDGQWVQTQRLSPPNGNAGDSFGFGPAVQGNRLIVGSPFHDTQRGDAVGAAYIFDRVDGTWQPTTKLSASDGDFRDWFGQYAAIEGDLAVVGAPRDDIDEEEWAGSVYIFQLMDGEWREVQKLVSPSNVPGYRFGEALAIHGDTIVVGAPRETHSGQPAAGAAYLYQPKDGRWEMTQRIVAGDPGGGDLYAIDIELNDDLMLIGSYLDDNENGTAAGSVYLYRPGESGWEFEQKILADEDESQRLLFGWALDFDGDRAVIGGPFYQTNRGAAYVFKGLAAGACDPCDTNCDGSVDLTDVESFIDLLIGGKPCADCSGDTNDDGSVDLTDVEGFIECLLG